MFTSYSASKFLRVREEKGTACLSTATFPVLHSTYSTKVDTTVSVSPTTEAPSNEEPFLRGAGAAREAIKIKWQPSLK